MESNPLIPLWTDVIWTAMLLLWIGLTLTGLVSVARSDMDGVSKFGWCAVVLLIPVLGAAVWFYAQRRRVDAG